MQAS
jgi:hypothetical protein